MRDKNSEQKELKHQLERLLKEHRELDEEITKLSHTVASDDVKIHRLKKRKLQLKDQITKLEDMLTPNLIA